MIQLNSLESAVLNKLLEGNHPALATLRDQLRVAMVRSRRLTGAGFFTEIELPPETTPARISPGSFQFGDVEASIPGLQHGAGFLVYIRNGMLQMLEGYSYEEPWPQRTDIFELRYSEPERESLTTVFHGAWPA
jgi:hypothetical protein